MTVDPRHSRNVLFPAIGTAGQERLYRSRIAIVGCGALGSHAAELLTRAGAGRSEGGFLRLIDRDYVDVTNLQRQALFDSEDAALARPKATAAERRLRAIDPAVNCQAFVRDINPANATNLLRDTDLILDATDNFRTRFLVNDAAIALNVPWIYAGAVASRGVVSMIVPGVTACFRCMVGAVPPLGAADSCDTAGIITPLPALVAAMQVAIAMRYLVQGTVQRGVTSIDLWEAVGETSRRFTSSNPDPDCDSCGRRLLPSLNDDSEQTVTLCGRNSVQFYSSLEADLDAAAARLENVVEVVRHASSLTARIPQGRLTVFDDGRVIVEGTTDPLEAKTLVARYFGG